MLRVDKPACLAIARYRISLAEEKKRIRTPRTRFWQLISCRRVSFDDRDISRKLFPRWRLRWPYPDFSQENWNSRSFAKWVRLGRVRLGNYIPSATRVGTTLKLLTNFQLTSSTFGAMRYLVCLPGQIFRNRGIVAGFPSSGIKIFSPNRSFSDTSTRRNIVRRLAELMFRALPANRTWRCAYFSWTLSRRVFHLTGR